MTFIPSPPVSLARGYLPGQQSLHGYPASAVEGRSPCSAGWRSIVLGRKRSCEESATLSSGGGRVPALWLGGRAVPTALLREGAGIQQVCSVGDCSGSLGKKAVPLDRRRRDTSTLWTPMGDSQLSVQSFWQNPRPPLPDSPVQKEFLALPFTIVITVINWG